MSSTVSTLVAGFGYLEAPRWHDGHLWFSDLGQKKVWKMAPDGVAEVVATVPTTPVGLGFRPDGTLLVVSSDDRRLLQVTSNGVETAADLADVAVFAANDMAVDGAGRCYVSHFGYDLFGGEEPRATGIVLVQPDGSVELTGDDLMFPNGIVISRDGRTLVVAESFGFRLTAFDIREDGRLENKRLFAQFDDPEKDLVDGLCIDAEDGVWVGCPNAGEYRRVVEGGAVTDCVVTAADASFGPACALGGPDLHTLYLAVTDTTLADLADGWSGSGRIDVVQVKVPVLG